MSTSIYIHEKFDTFALNNDIALIELSRSVDFDGQLFFFSIRAKEFS